jgi:hypothetical protein
MYNAAPTPQTDIRGTLSCRHAVRTTCATMSCAHASIVLEKKNYSCRVVHPARFKLRSKILLPVALFEGGIASDTSIAAKSSFSTSVAPSFASAFPRALEVDLFFGVVASLSGSGEGEISAQSEPGDKGPPAPSSVGVASVGLVIEDTTFDCTPSSLIPARGGGCVLLQPLCYDSRIALACNSECPPILQVRRVEEEAEEAPCCQGSCSVRGACLLPPSNSIVCYLAHVLNLKPLPPSRL